MPLSKGPKIMKKITTILMNVLKNNCKVLGNYLTVCFKSLGSRKTWLRKLTRKCKLEG